MRIVLLVLLLIVNVGAFAFQPPKRHIIDSAVIELDRALLSKDTTYLKNLIDDKATYGHSNGWIETKRDVVNDLYNGKLTYQQITTTEKAIEYNGKLAVVRTKADVDVLVNNSPVHVNLSILQVWQMRHKRWVLIARQSVKI